MEVLVAFLVFVGAGGGGGGGSSLGTVLGCLIFPWERMMVSELLFVTFVLPSVVNLFVEFYPQTLFFFISSLSCSLGEMTRLGY